ncbi:MAG: hypothetical protein ACRD16_08180 [Thermoanaerobaculia bacterium]
MKRVPLFRARDTDETKAPIPLAADSGGSVPGPGLPDCAVDFAALTVRELFGR